MREIPETNQKEWFELFDKIDKRKNLIGRLYGGNFKNNPVEILDETIKSLEEELAIWKAMKE